MYIFCLYVCELFILVVVLHTYCNVQNKDFEEKEAKSAGGRAFDNMKYHSFTGHCFIHSVADCQN